MSTTTPTEAHIALVRNMAAQGYYLGCSGSIEDYARLIAASEARAIATQLEVVVILTRRWLRVEKERDQLRERAERAEAELAVEQARLDWVFRNCKVTADDYTTGNRDVYAIHDREDLGAAMKGDAK